MSEQTASVSIVMLCVIAIGTLAGVAARNKSAAASSPRNRAAWSLAGWSVVVIVGLAIWIIARTQVSH